MAAPGITKNGGYFYAVVIEFIYRQFKTQKMIELPSCYDHSNTRKIVHKLFDCPSFG